MVRYSDPAILRPAAMRLDAPIDLPAGGIDLEQLERSLVVQALERTGWHHTKTGALLGLNRDQVRYRIEKFRPRA
jgi:transcriptional regulator with GAF, ATPase, and Fis domain